MARFSRIAIEPGTAPQTRWKMIRDEMVVAESVEVIKKHNADGTVSFELRVWTGVRNDGSNARRAAVSKSY